MAPSVTDATALWLTEHLLADGASDADALVLERMATELDRGTPLDEQLVAFTLSRRETPGEFGLEHAVAWLLPLAVTAVKRFMEAFVKKLGEKAAELAVDGMKDRVRTSLVSDPDTFALLETSFSESAAAMNLPRATYASYLEELRRRPDILLPKR